MIARPRPLDQGGFFCYTVPAEIDRETMRTNEEEQRMIQGAIFDADGTLLDSMGMWDTVGERYLIAQGLIS